MEITVITVKKCSLCLEEFPLSLEFFYRHKHCIGGIDSACKKCRLRQGKKYSKAHKERRRNATRKSTDANLEKFLLRQTRRKANIEGRKFDLTLKWVKARLNRAACEVTGLPFECSKFALHNGRTNSLAPSIDRKDSSKGYTRKNCQMVVWIYNRAKGDSQHEDVMRMVEALV